MSVVARVKLRWSGFIGGPGYSILHFSGDLWDTDADVTAGEAQLCVDKVDTFAAAINDYLPYGCQLATEPEVEVLNVEDGELQNVVTTVPAAAQTAVVSSSATFAGPVGAVISWKTGGVRGGRRIHGRTYLVPLVSTTFASDGTLTVGARSDFTGAATALRTAFTTHTLVVYARPTGPAATDGQLAAVTSSSVPDMAAVLRSRRD